MLMIICHLFQEKQDQTFQANCREDPIIPPRGAMKETLTDFPGQTTGAHTCSQNNTSSQKEN